MPDHKLAVMRFATIVPFANTLGVFKKILPAATRLKSDVDVNDPAPVAVDINVFANTLPVNRIFPPEIILKSPVAVNVPVPGAVDIKLLAITLPALILPVYVDKNEATLAFAN